MSKNKILVIINNLGKGGAEKQLLLLIKHLSLKYKFFILLIGDSDSSIGSSHHDCTLLKVEMNGTILKPSNIKNLFKIRKFIKEEHIQVVFSWLFKPNFIAAILKLLSPKTFLIVSKRGSNHWFNKIHYFINKFIYKICNRIVTNSTDLKQEILSYNHVESKILVIPNGIELFESGYLTENHSNSTGFKREIVIGCIGRFSPEKRYFDIIEAFYRTLEVEKAIRLIIVGGRGNFEIIKQTALELNIFDKCCFVGEVEDVSSHLRNFDIFLLASSSEGMPNSLMEAMAFGKPIVATNVGAIPDLIEDGCNGFLVPPYQPKRISNCLLELINNKDLRDKFSKNNMTKIKLFSCETMIKRYDELFKTAFEKTTN